MKTINKYSLLLVAIAFLCYGCKSTDNPTIPTEGLTGGLTSLVARYEDDGIFIPLLSGKDNIVINPKNEYINWEIVEKDGQRFLKIMLPDSIKQKIEPSVEKITFSDGNESKNVYLLLRSVGKEDDHIYESDPFYAIGRGMNLAGSYAGNNQKQRIMSYSLIMDEINKNKIDVPSSVTHNITDSRYDEATKEMTESIGIGGDKLIAKQKCVFSGTINETVGTNETEKSYYEYNISMTLKKMRTVKIFAETKNSDAEYFAKYLDSTANDVLNNPSSKMYQTYANTEKEIFDLYDAYGTHMMASGVFGGMYMYIYGRKENSYYQSTAVSAGAELKYGKVPTVPADANWMQTYLSTMNTDNVNVSAEVNTYDEELTAVSQSISNINVIGGNASSDYTSWDASITPDAARSYALIGYEDIYGDSTGGLIPLYRFVLDTTSERYKALKNNLEPYLESKYKETVAKKMVLADVMMLKAENDYTETLKQKVMLGPDGKTKLLYNAMVANKHAAQSPNDNREYAVETSMKPYIYVGDNTDQHWWYAVAFEEECNGITDIIFSDIDISGYTKRGDRADDGMNYNGIDNNYVYLKFDSKGNTTKQHITGFGLAKCDDKDAFTGLVSSRIFATTGGTEMTKPFETDANFTKYWGSSSKYKYSSSYKNSWWGSVAADRWHIFPVYTYETLPIPFKYTNILQPKEW